MLTLLKSFSLIGFVCVFGACTEEKPDNRSEVTPGRGSSVLESDMELNVFVTAESVLEYLDTHQSTKDEITLNISDGFKFAGSNDVSGAGMAIVLDRLLGLNYLPNSFDQKSRFQGVSIH